MDISNVVYDPETGMVWIEHWNSNPSPYTMPQHNVSLGLVDEHALPEILAIKVKACCGVDRLKYQLASAINVSVWKTGDRPR